MKLSEIKNYLTSLENITFELPNGIVVPPYFHVSEVGKITRNFIDCGGVLRKEEKVNFQLWTATDYDHRLSPSKLIEIIEKSEKTLNLSDLEIEVEYQSNTIGKYDLDFKNNSFVLVNKSTACLAEGACGTQLEQEKPKVKLSELQNENSCCDPKSGCC